MGLPTVVHEPFSLYALKVDLYDTYDVNKVPDKDDTAPSCRHSLK
jgi:hypothetical protein